MKPVKWFKAVKKPIEITVEEYSEPFICKTLEGEYPYDPNKHYIIVGIDGERYPIEKGIFDRTYERK